MATAALSDLEALSKIIGAVVDQIDAGELPAPGVVRNRLQSARLALDCLVDGSLSELDNWAGSAVQGG